MSHRPDQLTDEVINQFLRARSADSDLGLLDDIMRTVGAMPQERPWLRLRPTPLPRRALFVVALALLLAAMGAIAVGSRLIRPDPVPADQLATVHQMVDAIHARDADAFIEAFLPEATFDPGGNFRESSSLFGNSLPLADADLVEAWMAINDAWDFEAEIIGCKGDPDAEITYGYGEGRGDPMVVNCEVATRWHRLSLEVTEQWSYEFHGSGLGHWGFALLDLNPPDRALPLGYDGLEAWEAWLAATDPASAARYLNPRISEPPNCDGCPEWWEAQAPGDPRRAARLAPLLWSAQNEWSIQGHDFTPSGLIPYDPALADEIENSIQDYLGEVQS